MTLVQKEKHRLYCLKGKGLLAKIFSMSRKELESIWKDRNKLFKNGTIKDKKGKVRLTTVPIGKLRKLHDILASLLSQIQPPNYLKSCKGESYIKNAQFHLEAKHLINMDIDNFFPTCKTEYGFRFFHHYLKINADTSWFLCDLIFKDGYLPTGSPVSPVLAFWMHKPIFDEIQSLSKQEGMKFTLYVDDMTFSKSYRIDRKLDSLIRTVLKKHEIKVKKKKTRYFDENSPKVVTGNVIHNGKHSTKHSLKKEIFSPLRAVNKDLTKLSSTCLKSIEGKVQVAREIEGKEKYINLKKNISNELKNRAIQLISNNEV